MSSKVKRKVTVENNKDSSDQPRRPSVFERLGPGAVNIPAQSQDRHNRNEQQGKCRHWLRSGECMFGNTCRFQHDPYSNSSRRNKTDKDINEKDLRHKVRNKRDDTKESRTGSISPKRKGSKRNSSRSRKGEHESKIKSTVVVTRPRSPATKNPDPEDREKKKTDGNWDEDSDDWPIDSAQLDYKEELTLERKRQQLQRELELEIQKEKMLKESVTITKTVSFSESSSSSSSSDSGSISSSSDSSSSSSGDDSDDTSSSSSSSSSSASRPPIKRKLRKPIPGKESEKGPDISHQKPREDYDKLKSSRAAKCNVPKRSPVHSPDPKLVKKTREKRNITPPLVPSPKHRHANPHESGSGVNRGNASSRSRGPRTPSPPTSRKQRLWEQSSSADSRSADVRQSHVKRHKKKKDLPRNDVYKSDRPPTPPPLSSPNRTALLPANQFGKKARQRVEDFQSRSHARGRESSPLLLSKISGHSNSPSVRMLGSQGHNSSERDKSLDKHGLSTERPKQYSRKLIDDLPPRSKRSNSQERSMKRPRLSPRREGFKETFSPLRDRGEGDGFTGGNSRKSYASPIPHFEKGDDKSDRRKRSASPVKTGKDCRDRSLPFEQEKKRDYRDTSPRNSRENYTRNSDPYCYNKKEEPKTRRGISPELKKGRDDKARDRGIRERNLEHEPVSWNEEHKKTGLATSANRTTDSRAWQDVQQAPPASRPERSRERERDRKKGKDRDIPLRLVEEGDRQRLPSPIRTRSPIHSHHPLTEVETSAPSQRNRMYDSDIPPGERDYGYGYDSHRDSMYMNDRLMPAEYSQEVMRGSSLYGSEPYSDNRYRRDIPLKEQSQVSHIDRVSNYGGREGLSSRDLHPSRDSINLSGRNDDFISEIPIDDRHSYDERWNRNRPVRDDWDLYPTLPPSSLPLHVTAPLDEDRYGMPRRRRASPEWAMSRTDDREIPSQLNHRQGNHSSLPPGQRDQRTSRSPQPKRVTDGGGPNRASWGEHSSRHSSRNNDNRTEVLPKLPLLDDKKVRNSRRDRRDRSKRRDGSTLDVKSQAILKDKTLNKRPVSPSPQLKEVKKKKDDIPSVNSLPPTEKNLGVNKRSREELKSEQKPPTSSRNHKTVKAEPPSPKGNSDSRSSFQEKIDVPVKASSTSGKIPLVVKVEKEERKRQRNNEEKSQADDDFSDWSDGDDDLLNRDDFNEVELDDNEKPRIKHEDDRERNKKSSVSNSAEAMKTSDTSTKQLREHVIDSKSKLKENHLQSHSRNQSKERVSDEFSGSNKDGDASQDLKEYEAIDSFMVKDETDVDVDEYITTESVDYDPISDDELEALIEEPDDSLVKQNEPSENLGIVDALDVNWSTLMTESLPKPDFVAGIARKRFKVAHVLSRIGFSQALAGTELTEKVVKFCQNQLDEELAEKNEKSNLERQEKSKKFVMEHPVAAFHVAISQSKKERANIFSQLGPFRRALCARKDLQIRKFLCKPATKLLDRTPTVYSQQHSVDKDLYKKSIELLKVKKTEYQSRIVNVC